MQVHIDVRVHEVLHDEVALEHAGSGSQREVADMQFGLVELGVATIGEVPTEGQSVHALGGLGVLEPSISTTEGNVHAWGHAQGASPLHGAVEDNGPGVLELGEERGHIVGGEGGEQREVRLFAVYVEVKVHLVGDVDAALGVELHLLQFQAAQRHLQDLRSHVIVQVGVQLDVLVEEEGGVAFADDVQAQVGRYFRGHAVADHAEVGLQLRDTRCYLLVRPFLAVGEGEVAHQQIAQVDVQAGLVRAVGSGVELFRQQQVQAAVLV